jgi:hypothetical protein
VITGWTRVCPDCRNSKASKVERIALHAVVVAAMIDRLVHHAEVVRLNGDSYRLKTATSGECPTTTHREHRPDCRGQHSTGEKGSTFSRC